MAIPTVCAQILTSFDLELKGEFLNSGKPFNLGDAKKVIRIPPGHSVGLTALETVNFRPATV
jgi:hypothetical protein